MKVHLIDRNPKVARDGRLLDRKRSTACGLPPTNLKTATTIGRVTCARCRNADPHLGLLEQAQAALGGKKMMFVEVKGSQRKPQRKAHRKCDICKGTRRLSEGEFTDPSGEKHRFRLPCPCSAEGRAVDENSKGFLKALVGGASGSRRKPKGTTLRRAPYQKFEDRDLERIFGVGEEPPRATPSRRFVRAELECALAIEAAMAPLSKRSNLWKDLNDALERFTDQVASLSAMLADAAKAAERRKTR